MGWRICRLSVRLVPTWQDGPIGAAGWIAIALVILASWRPWRAIFDAYLFGAATRLGLTLQTLGEPWSNVPSTLPATIPFVLAIVAMIVFCLGGASPSSWSAGHTGNHHLQGAALDRFLIRLWTEMGTHA